MSRRSRYAPDNLPRPWHWMDDAACSGEETTKFFPVTDGIPMKTVAAEAKTFCHRCPVRSSCLAHALSKREDYGVWGGLDEDERAEMLHQARLAAERQRRQEREQERANAGAAA